MHVMACSYPSATGRHVVVVATQTERPMRLKTPLGPDALLVTGLSGREGMSQLYSFQLDMLAPADKAVDFAKLLGEPVTVELEAAPKQMRHFHGIVSRFSQGRRDATYAHYRMEVVPPFWLLTLRTQSR